MGYMEQYKEQGSVWAKRALKATAAVIVVGVLGIAAVKFCDHIPRTVAKEENGVYSAALQATSSPFLFGPQDGRIVLKRNGKSIQTEDFWIANDGKYMDESNWSVEWQSDRVIVTIMGEEQSDHAYTFFYF